MAGGKLPRWIVSKRKDSRYVSGWPPLCVPKKLDSAIVVMQSPDERMRRDASDLLNRARVWRVLVQRSVCSHLCHLICSSLVSRRRTRSSWRDRESQPCVPTFRPVLRAEIPVRL
jgi:hypothetical protein